MKVHLKTIIFLLITVYAIPGLALYFLERTLLIYYLIINTATIIPFYVRAARQKRSCRILGYRFYF